MQTRIHAYFPAMGAKPMGSGLGVTEVVRTESSTQVHTQDWGQVRTQSTRHTWA